MHLLLVIVVPLLIFSWLADTADTWFPLLIYAGMAVLAVFAFVVFWALIVFPVWRWAQNRFDPDGRERRERHDAAQLALAAARKSDALERKALKEKERIEATAYRSGTMTGHQFEHWTAKRLNALGWYARATQASGDQGADVIAQRNGKSVVIQCKLVGKPVGNKAVQQIYAAQRHYGASAAAVVTNNTFTPSAKVLAGSTGVLHVHADDLASLHWRLGI